MKARTLIFISLAVLFGTTDTSAQFFKDKLKKAAQEIGQKVKDEANQKTKEKNQSTQQSATMSSKKRSSKQQAEAKTISACWPKNHTALFAPIGDPINPKYGTRNVKAVRPPKDETKQPDWNDSRPFVYELDNQSLVQEYELLNECMDTRYIEPTSPASFRFHAVLDELAERTKVLNKIVSAYDEAEFEAEDGNDGFADLHRKRLASLLKGRPYHTLVRSSIAPFFTFKGNLIDKATVDYFKAHGGYENAHKANFTVYTP